MDSFGGKLIIISLGTAFEAAAPTYHKSFPATARRVGVKCT